jgi:excisionase family DNA binding protein
MTPPQAARELGVATITIYKWVETKKLPATTVQTGHATRIYIDPEAVALKKAEIEALGKGNDANVAIPHDQGEWVRLYQEQIGKVPPLYGAFRQGKITFEQMKGEAFRRFDLLRG